ncbi:MAG: fluoride efflux transporter CrcB [Tannerellaceae bacterium]|nr:fluoride efflux transporter CrcB [Tannerellaceae bacterium]
MVIAGIGGGVGSALRFFVSVLMKRYCMGSLFPLATFFVNVTGCVLIGLFVGLSDRYEVLDKNLNLLLVTGFCGGYTTFSAFSLENIRLLEGHHYVMFAIYVSGSVAVGIASVFLGFLLSKL